MKGLPKLSLEIVRSFAPTNAVCVQHQLDPTGQRPSVEGGRAYRRG
jgi:hypothetical protein